MRINKYIARSGVASRRKAEDLVSAGKVSINGKTIETLSTNVGPNDKVMVEGSRVAPQKKVYYMLNKPDGYTSTRSDPFARHSIFELLPEDSSLFSVGRLDRDTTGLLLVTNDGDFAENIIHPRKKIEKEYLVRTKEKITDEEIAMLKNGIDLEDGFAVAKSAEKTSENEATLIIEMGRKRIVRRMIASTGNKVTALKRNRIGSIKLDIPIGQWRKLRAEEIKNYA